MWTFMEKSDFQGGGGGHKKPLYTGELPKKGVRHFVDLRGGLTKKGVLMPQCTL